VDVSKTTLPSTAHARAEQAVRAEVEAAFNQNPTLVDSLFFAATLAACVAQGITPNLCPNPPSFVLSLSGSGSAGTSPHQSEPGSILVPAVAGALGSLFLVSVTLGVLWWRAKSSRSEVSPPPEAPGLMIRQIGGGIPSAGFATDPSLNSPPSGSSNNPKRQFAVRNVFEPSTIR
jgi:hypothetical protein